MEQIPKIRFSQFDNKWNSILIGNLAKIKRGASPRPIQNPKWFDENSDIGWLRISDVTEQNGRIKYLEQKISKLGQEKTRVLNTPHLLLSIAATVGKPVVNYVKTGVHDGFLIFENPKFDREFMFQWFDMFRPKWNKYGQPGSQVNLNSDIIRNHKMMIPPLPEQSAIGSLFRTLDDLLASYKENLANYHSLKATMLSKMFPKAGQTVPEIRLDGFEGEWVEKRLKDISKRVTRKNNGLVSERALTISAQFGLVDQEEFFQKKVASKDVSGYYLIKNGEFAYNKSYSTGYPLGAIKRLDKYEHGVLSTLYILFKVVDVDSDYLAHYYESDKWHREVSMCAAEGARNHGLLNIAPVDFFSTRLVIPEEREEQQAIAAYFSNLDNLIVAHQEKISQLETLKKKLLQDMFI